MVTKIKYAAVVLSITAFLPTATLIGGEAGELQPCRQFVVTGTQATYEQCVKHVKRAQGREEPLSYEKFVGTDHWVDFLDAVAAGDRRSLNIAFMLMRLMDGAAASSLSQHIAEIIIDSPAEFLQRFHDAELDRTRASTLVVSVPLRYVDHLNERIALLQRRVKAIETVDAQELRATQVFVLRVLTERIEELQDYVAAEEGADR